MNFFVFFCFSLFLKIYLIFCILFEFKHFWVFFVILGGYSFFHYRFLFSFKNLFGTFVFTVFILFVLFYGRSLFTNQILR